MKIKKGPSPPPNLRGLSPELSHPRNMRGVHLPNDDLFKLFPSSSSSVVYDEILATYVPIATDKELRQRQEKITTIKKMSKTQESSFLEGTSYGKTLQQGFKNVTRNAFQCSKLAALRKSPAYVVWPKRPVAIVDPACDSLGLGGGQEGGCAAFGSVYRFGDDDDDDDDYDDVFGDDDDENSDDDDDDNDDNDDAIVKEYGEGERVTGDNDKDVLTLSKLHVVPDTKDQSSEMIKRKWGRQARKEVQRKSRGKLHTNMSGREENTTADADNGEEGREEGEGGGGGGGGAKRSHSNSSFWKYAVGSIRVDSMYLGSPRRDPYNSTWTRDQRRCFFTSGFIPHHQRPFNAQQLMVDRRKESP